VSTPIGATPPTAGLAAGLRPAYDEASDEPHDADPEAAMTRRLLVLLCLAGAAGCVTPDDRRDWADAMRDLRGENMRMHTGPGADPGPAPRPTD
jgi:hypothetical protein